VRVNAEARSDSLERPRLPHARLGFALVRGVGARCFVGAAAALLGLAVRIPLQPLLGQTAPFATFYAAAMLAAWYGGVVSGVIASALSLAAVDEFLLVPHGALRIDRAPDDVAAGAFLASSLLVSVMQEVLHRRLRLATEQGARIARVQAFSAALAEAATTAQVVAVAVREGVAASGAAGGTLRLLDAERRLLLLPVVHGATVGSRGGIGGGARVGAAATMRVDAEGDAPALRVMRGEELALERCRAADGAEWTTVGLPLSADGHALGVLELDFRRWRQVDAAERAFLRSLARQCGHALDRARLFEGEHRALARLAVLAEVGRVLAGNVALEELPNVVGRVLVPGAADACVLEIYDDAGACVARGVSHVEPRLEARLRAAPLATPPSPLQLAVQGHGSLRVSEADTTDHPAILGQVGARRGTLVVVPILRGATVEGALALIGLRGGRRYGDDDLTLAEEIAARAASAIEQARLNAELLVAVRVRDDFLSVASHELNTPLTPLRLHLGALRRGRADPAKMGERFAALDRQVDRLAQLVGQLLDVSRITAGRLALELAPVDFAAIVRETAQRMEGPLAASGSALTLDVPESLVGSWDAMRLEQIATNLLTNAIKYGERRPIAVRLEELPDARARLTVRDHGIGIAAEHLERIFGRFERAVSVRHFGGFGLGLWIVRQVVEALGGTIRVDSVPGAGATFTVELPREA
jgi:signal transduction histidine kinase